MSRITRRGKGEQNVHISDVRSGFEAAAAKAPGHVTREATHELSSSDLPKGLGLVQNKPEWKSEWDLMVGQAPRTFYETLSCGIKGEVSVYLNFFDDSDSNFNVNIYESGRSVFKAENKLFHRSYGKFLYFKEWANEHPDSKCRGMGLTLFRNMVDMAVAGNLDGITLLGGRADGRFFWPAHGFYFRQESQAKRAIPEIAQKLAEYSNTIPDGIQKKAREILDQGGLDLCWHIARLPGKVDVDSVTRPLGWALLNISLEPEYEISLHDELQMMRVRSSLAHLDAVLDTAPKSSPIPDSLRHLLPAVA